VFENLYLAGLDAQLDAIPGSLYLRFGDDIIFVTPDRDVVLKSRAIIERELAFRRLVRHPEKSADFVLAHPHLLHSFGEKEANLDACAVFPYLGMDLDYRGAVLLPASKRKHIRDFLRARVRSCAGTLPDAAGPEHRVEIICRSLGVLLDAHRRGLSTPVRDYAQRTGDESSLRELDRWLALEVLRSALGRGACKGSFRRYPPRRLRSLGLPSLVHLRRTHVI
jgi:hypothetical protein